MKLEKICVISILFLTFAFFVTDLNGQFVFSAGTYLPQLTALASLFLHVAPLAGALALLGGGDGQEDSYGHSGSSSSYGGHGRAGHFRRKPGKKRYHQKRYYRSVRNQDSNIDDVIGKKKLAKFEFFLNF